MAQYNSLNIKLSNSKLNKLNFTIKNKTEVVLRLSSNMINNSNNEANFSPKLILTNRQTTDLHKVFANNSSADCKLSKTQLSKMIQSQGFIGRLVGQLLKTGLPLIKNLIKTLGKSVLIPLGLTVAVSAADGRIQNQILVSGTTTLKISNGGMEDVIKVVKSLEDSGLLLKGAL